jgi:DNA (cytosine-5)-methyltransferase 1
MMGDRKGAPLRYGSVCSGIDAATIAWHPLGWVPAFFSEIEKFPSAVLDHHYPTVPNLGDMTKFQEWPDHAIDLLVGGTPCQSFSIAGLRAGLADPRGNLMLTYLAIAARYQPRWLVWENVPGVLSSNGGRDFGTFLRGLAELGYGFAYRVLDAQFCRAHGYEWAVPQRRRRVFVVGYLGDWRRAAAVLFDGQSLRGDPAPRREAGKGFAADVVSSLTASGRGVERAGETRGQDPVIAVQANSGDVGYCLTVSAQQSLDAETETLLAHSVGFGGNVARALTARHDSSPCADRGMDIVAQPVCFSAKDHGADAETEVSPTLRVGGHNQSHANAGVMPAISWSIMPQNSGKDYKARPVDVAQPIMVGGPVGGNQGGDYIQQAWAVRRLTPTECERLQGFPDNFTAIPYRGKVAADGPRYKALGNSMAVNVMRVIGTRLAMVDAIVKIGGPSHEPS